MIMAGRENNANIRRGPRTSPAAAAAEAAAAAGATQRPAADLAGPSGGTLFVCASRPDVRPLLRRATRLCLVSCAPSFWPGSAWLDLDQLGRLPAARLVGRPLGRPLGSLWRDSHIDIGMPLN